MHLSNRGPAFRLKLTRTPSKNAYSGTVLTQPTPLLFVESEPQQEALTGCPGSGQYRCGYLRREQERPAAGNTVMPQNIAHRSTAGR
jgi:hypothetical protein